MTNESKSAIEKFHQIQKREKSLGVWESCESAFRIQENQNAVGALLIHGFGASPYEMKVLEEHLFKEGFNVYSARLSGHATNDKNFAGSKVKEILKFKEGGHRLMLMSDPNRDLLFKRIVSFINK